jgi:ATP-dependent Zn protease
MSFIVKNSQLTDDTISALNTLIDLDIDAKSAFRLTRIIKEISSILEDKLKMEKRILEKWVQKDEQGNVVPVKDEQGNVVNGAVNITDPDSFSQEMSNLMDVENDIPFEKIKFDDLNLQTAKVKDLIKLEFLFE